jgi:pyruvate, orthophosphate dikinase
MPLLVSVRSGARDSMPGMMDTILNLGLNDQTVLALVKATPRTSASPGIATAASSRCTATSSWACKSAPTKITSRLKRSSTNSSTSVSRGHRRHQAHRADLQELVKRFKALIKERTGKEFPQDPVEAAWGAVGAVFGSWMNDRAIVYRRKYGIPAEWGTAVNVQAMVYGNTGDKSGSGVAFTRDPANGEKFSTANFSSTPRAKTSWPACARPNRWRN